MPGNVNQGLQSKEKGGINKPLNLDNRTSTKPIETRTYSYRTNDSIIHSKLCKSLIYIDKVSLRCIGYEPRGRGFNSCQPHQPI